MREANTKKWRERQTTKLGRNILNGGKVRKTERRPEMHWQIIGTGSGGGEFKKRRHRGGTFWEDVFPSFGTGNRAEQKKQ